jgi:hypothetical protein
MPKPVYIQMENIYSYDLLFIIKIANVLFANVIENLFKQKNCIKVLFSLILMTCICIEIKRERNKIFFYGFISVK